MVSYLVWKADAADPGIQIRRSQLNSLLFVQIVTFIILRL